jgi:hypothetical protein
MIRAFGSAIFAAVQNIDVPMLMRVWQELEYRIDVQKKLFQFSCGCEQFY